MSEGTAKKEEKPRKFQAIRGTRDLLPPETALWSRIEQTAHEVFATYGYGEIRPPIFESTELFARGVGGDTDIVGKEMYTLVDRLEKLPDPSSLGDYGAFIQQAEKLMDTEELPAVPGNRLAIERMKKIWDRGNVFRAQDEAPIEKIDQAVLEELYTMVVLKDSMELGQNISLRPEATASVCRAYIEHNMQQWPQPVKLYYIGPMFRRERPQKGRYRQFYQIGAEVLETFRPDASKDIAKELAKDAAVDAEVIEMLMTFFDRVGLQGTELSVNSIGHTADNCRRAYIAELRAALNAGKDLLGDDSKRRIETNPLRILDSKVDKEQALIWTLPRIADHLCNDCKMHYAALKRELDLRGVKYRENWRLVRGLDYYMRTTFEITAKGLGSQDAVCGGGRYDGLVELLGGPPTKGIGFAIGEDRLILSLQEAGKAPAAQGRDIYIAWMGEKAYATAVRAAKNLRAAGYSVELPPVEQKFGKALGQADKLGARYALILGDNEVASGEWTVKTLETSEQAKFSEASLLEFLRKSKAVSS